MRGWFGRRRPDISVVVVVHNMAREAPRTLLSLSAGYQRHIGADDYEVIVVDNGSTPPLAADILAGLAGNFRLIRLDPAPPSPALAINRGLAETRGAVIGVMIDGARIVTPGLLHFARLGAQLYPRPIVVTLGWYLGFDIQRWAIESGYNAAREDALLASIGWPNDGYRLFEVAAPDEPSADGWFRAGGESNCLFLRREAWDALGGAEERFDAPGGGLLNADILRRAMELPEREVVILLGEGTFHQVHGGIATNADVRTFGNTFGQWAAQYESIRGRPWALPLQQDRTYVGVFPRPALAHFARSIVEPIKVRPLGPSFDRSLWSLAPAPCPSDPIVKAVVDLAETEFRARRFEAAAALARMARARAPDEPAPQRLLAHAGAWLIGQAPAAENRRASFHLARAKAFHLLGDATSSAAEYRAALSYEEDLVQAHIGLAKLRMPGDDYFVWLQRFQAALVPETYFEIGIDHGHSLSYARAPTRAIAVDPEPLINVALKSETHIFCETSDTFFAERRLATLVADHPLGLAFIDGLHVFEQSLRDFINVETFCSPRSVVLIHDTIPLDEVTQRPIKQRRFYTGDVWKTVLCLKHYRPDLDIFTVAAPWSGLTVVTGLDPTSRVLADQYEAAVTKFIDTPFSNIENRLDSALNIVPNDWGIVEARLKGNGIL